LLHDGLPYYDPIQDEVQGHAGPKVAKMADFKVYLLHRYMHMIKRQNNIMLDNAGRV